MRVLKFGGSSLAQATRISAVMDIVEAALAKDRVVLVCSAISGCTDALIEIGSSSDRRPLLAKLQERHYAIIARLFTGEEREKLRVEIGQIFEQIAQYQGNSIEAFGEVLLTRILAAKFAGAGYKTRWLDSRELILKRGEDVDTAVSYARIAEAIASNLDTQIFVAPGFVASNEEGKTTTLGRGGSDYSAALYAAALKADTLQIWTDVSGILTANPKDISRARTINIMSYEAARCMAENGAKVLYAPTVQPAMDAGIDINIRNTFNPEHRGTIICRRDMPTSPIYHGLCSVADMEQGIDRICLVAEGNVDRDSTSLRILRALQKNGLMSLSEVFGEGTVFYIEVAHIVAKAALGAIHKEFFESRALSSIDVYIAGYGAVAKALITMIAQNADRISEREAKAIRIVGVANSKRYIIDHKGLELDSIESRLYAASYGDDYVDAVSSSALNSAVFVDCTDSDTLYKQYPKLFSKGISVVSSNRRSLAVPYPEYVLIKRMAAEQACFFRYDTTVGASLPILESIASSENCSDEISRIEAVVSCTANMLLSSYRPASDRSFAALLREAQCSGLTESDPRFDLGGRDVLRKLLILAREAGVMLEETDVEIEPLLPQSFFGCDLDSFYSMLADYEPVLAARVSELESRGLRARFVASLCKDDSCELGYKAQIKMREVGIDSPFYFICGTENVIEISSLHSSPLVIKGAGEGAKQAAIGIIKDILL